MKKPEIQKKRSIKRFFISVWRQKSDHYTVFVVLPLTIVDARAEQWSTFGWCDIEQKLCFNFLPRKEVIHAQLPLHMPCYDLVLIIGTTFVPLSGPSGISDSLDLTGGEYKTRERIQRTIADMRLLANPASWGRVAALNPNWDQVWWD